jgi:hypothetical protein
MSTWGAHIGAMKGNQAASYSTNWLNSKVGLDPEKGRQKKGNDHRQEYSVAMLDFERGTA